MNPIGWREYESAPQANPATLEALRELAVSLLSDNMGRASGMVGLTAYHKPKQLVGTAVTIRTRGGDNLAIHRAFDFCRPGDVMVIDGGGDLSQALMGEIMVSQCIAIGIAGVVVYGAVRDTEAIRDLGFPMYAIGANPNGPSKLVPGRINWPVSVGGVTVNPGDLVVDDGDGVVVVEPAKVPAVLQLAEKKLADETARLDGIRSGAQLRPTWLDAALRKAGVLAEGETL